jgi:uncharacterized membrane protein
VSDPSSPARPEAAEPRSSDPSPRGGRAPSRWRSPLLWLGIAAGAYFAVAFVFSWVRALELQTTTWDFGLYQQALWSTAHGRAFYETADVETGGFQSLLQVHSVFLFYLLVPVYSAFPSNLTLFAAQAAVVALAAFPLYFLARDVTGSPRLALAAGVLFLAWAPTLTSNLYDFHPEAFLPVELFAIVFLWNRGRYGPGFAVAAVAFVTMELAPVLVFFVGIYFLFPSKTTATRWRSSLRTDGWRRAVASAMRTAARTPRMLASLGLLAASALAYGALLYVRESYLTATLGTQPLPFGGSGYVIGATPAALGLAWSNLAVGWEVKLSAWLLLLALLGFIPLLAPRALVFVAPWFVFTFFSSNLNYVTLGFQYGFVAGCGLMLAFVFGLPELERLRLAARHLAGTEGTGTPALDPRSAGRGPVRAHRGKRPLFLVAFAVLLVINIALTPVNPLADGSGAGYRFSYRIPPGYDSVRELADLIPPGAPVIATDNLFPFVANDENAYSFFWGPYNFLNLPFGPARLPDYVLVAENRTYAVPAWLAGALNDPSTYGVRGVVWSSIARAVLLYERGYAGPPTAFGPPPAPPSAYYGSELAAPGTSYVTSETGARFPEVVRSAPGALGPVWSGPGIDLPEGNYTVTLWLAAQAWTASIPPPSNAAVLAVTADAFGLPSLYNATFSFAALNSTGWVAASFSLDLRLPTVQLSVSGSALDPSATITLEYLSVETSTGASASN